MPSLIDDIFDAMVEDDDDREEQSRLLANQYQDLDLSHRNALDAAVTCICGYSLDTLIYRRNCELDYPQDLDFEDAA